MQTLFQYNWVVREDWYRWCENVPSEELLRVRNGGVGGILHTLFHIVDVEWSWIRAMQGKTDFQEGFEGYQSLQKVQHLDVSFRPEVREFVRTWHADMENHHGPEDQFTWGEIMRHMIAHEIHHIGQLSVWSREIDKTPVSANLIGRGLKKI